ncbi:Replication protein A 70 kDa DNA-binding subunit C [Arachis hypogaea]|nr:Replication protein A 70 kDa DNA-binding subunit C [Arachis hypogaea]
MPPPFDMISKMHPPREAWRLKVRVLRLWVVPSFGNHDVPNSMEMILLDEHCGKIQATVKKPLLNRFRDHIVEGQVYRMAYFTVVSNHGSYRATSHKFKLVFLHRIIVVAVDEDVIPKTCFNMFPFSELLNMTKDYDFLVDVIGLLTSVGEEKEYAKEEKIVKMIVLELTSKDLTVRCALFGDYVNQVNYFLASGYVEQPVVVIQLAKVKFFRGQVGLQNVMYATQILFNPDLSEVVEFRQRRVLLSFLVQSKVLLRMEVGGILLVCVERVSILKNGTYYCDFCLKHITNVTPRFKIKVTVEDHSGEDIFLLFDCEASYLLKKSCADLFTELVCGDTYPPIFQELIGKKLLLKVDTKGVPHDTFYGTFRVRRICDDPTIIAMFELPDYNGDDESTPKNIRYTYNYFYIEPDLHKSVPCGEGDIGIKKESSKTFIKSEKVASESSGILSKTPFFIDFLAGKQPAISEGTEFASLINGEHGNDEKTPSNDTVSDDLSAELDILLSSPEKETQVLSHVIDAPSQYGEKLIHENHVVSSKGKRNLNPQFQEAAADADGRGFKIAKVNRV